MKRKGGGRVDVLPFVLHEPTENEGEEERRDEIEILMPFDRDGKKKNSVAHILTPV